MCECKKGKFKLTHTMERNVKTTRNKTAINKYNGKCMEEREIQG
jgi:hypothetical protein